jgi:hypothetical protein
MESSQPGTHAALMIGREEGGAEMGLEVGGCRVLDRWTELMSGRTRGVQKDSSTEALESRNREGRLPSSVGSGIDFGGHHEAPRSANLECVRA